MADRHNGKGHDARHATETPDVSHIKNVDVTHEASDVDISGILKFVIGLTVLGAVVFVLMWGMFRLLSAQEVEKETAGGADGDDRRGTTATRTEAAGSARIWSKLENGEWVDPRKGARS